LGNRQYAEENSITVLNEYGDYGKRHFLRGRQYQKSLSHPLAALSSKARLYLKNDALDLLR